VVGLTVGLSVGGPVGEAVGVPVGELVGVLVGVAVGDPVEVPVGVAVGLPVGPLVGDTVGVPVVGLAVVGETLGWPLATVGLRVVGWEVGLAVGDPVGLAVGVPVGVPAGVPVGVPAGLGVYLLQIVALAAMYRSYEDIVTLKVPSVVDGSFVTYGKLVPMVLLPMLSGSRPDPM
jgi:hypothetical protein